MNIFYWIPETPKHQDSLIYAHMDGRIINLTWPVSVLSVFQVLPQTGKLKNTWAERKYRQITPISFQLWRWLDIKSTTGAVQFVASFQPSAGLSVFKREKMNVSQHSLSSAPKKWGGGGFQTFCIFLLLLEGSTACFLREKDGSLTYLKAFFQWKLGKRIQGFLLQVSVQCPCHHAA